MVVIVLSEILLAICILRLEISFSAKAMKRLSWLEAKV